MRSMDDILADLHSVDGLLKEDSDRKWYFDRLCELQTLVMPPMMVMGVPRASGWPKFQKEWLAEYPSCAACGGTVELQVHHIKPFHRHQELELCKTNVMTLCMAPYKLCHFIFGHAGSWAGVNPFVVEDATAHLSRINNRYSMVETSCS